MTAPKNVCQCGHPEKSHWSMVSTPKSVFCIVWNHKQDDFCKCSKFKPSRKAKKGGRK